MIQRAGDAPRRIAEEIARYTVRLTQASRPREGAPDFIDKWVKWGAGLRASQALVRGAKARALMHGRYHVSIKDIQALAKPILRHRVMTNFYAESERITPDVIVDMTTVCLRDLGDDRVEVTGTRGNARPDTLKGFAFAPAGYSGESVVTSATTLSGEATAGSAARNLVFQAAFKSGPQSFKNHYHRCPLIPRRQYAHERGQV
jgi:hypothetical protein